MKLHVEELGNVNDTPSAGDNKPSGMAGTPPSPDLTTIMSLMNNPDGEAVDVDVAQNAASQSGWNGTGT